MYQVFKIQDYYNNGAGSCAPEKVVDSPCQQLFSAAAIGQPAFTSSFSRHTDAHFVLAVALRGSAFLFMCFSNCRAHSRSLSLGIQCYTPKGFNKHVECISFLIKHLKILFFFYYILTPVLFTSMFASLQFSSSLLFLARHCRMSEQHETAGRNVDHISRVLPRACASSCTILTKWVPTHKEIAPYS